MATSKDDLRKFIDILEESSVKESSAERLDEFIFDSPEKKAARAAKDLSKWKSKAATKARNEQLRKASDYLNDNSEVIKRILLPMEFDLYELLKHPKEVDKLDTFGFPTKLKPALKKFYDVLNAYCSEYEAYKKAYEEASKKQWRVGKLPNVLKMFRSSQEERPVIGNGEGGTERITTKVENQLVGKGEGKNNT